MQKGSRLLLSAFGCGAQVGDFSERRHFGYHALLGGKRDRGWKARDFAGESIRRGGRRKAPEGRAAKLAAADPWGHVFTCPFTCVIVVDAAPFVKQFLETRAVSGGGDWSYYAVGRLIFAWFAFERPTGFPHSRIAVGQLGRPVTAPCTGIYWNGRLGRIDSMGTHVLVVGRTPLVDSCHPYHDGHLCASGVRA